MTLDLDALEKVARAATPGPWQSGSARFGYDVTETPYVAPEEGFYNVAQMYNAHFAMPDAEHIAAFNPATALALIARVRGLESSRDRDALVGLAQAWRDRAEAAEADRDALQAKVDAVATIHRRYTYYELEDSCPDTSEEHREEHHHESDEIGEFYCDQMPVSAHCEACWDECGDERLEYPCPTRRALGGDAE